MIYKYEVEYEMDKLKNKLNNNEMYKDKGNNFVVDYEYEFDYSHREIAEIQDEFIAVAAEYLKNNYKGQYVIMQSAWCVHILMLDFYKEKNMKFGTIC